MARLNQIVAVASGKKTRVDKGLTEVYHRLQKADQFTGLKRTYTPDDEQGEALPPETKAVQYTVEQAVEEARTLMTELFDVIATQETGNTKAKADVVVGDTVIVKDAPVSYLLFLEKQLQNIGNFVSKLPVLDTADEWKYDAAKDVYVTDPISQNRTKKVARNHVKYEATEQHPAQVEMYFEDVKVGVWNTVKFSGAMPAKDRKEMLERVRLLSEAVKLAREEANNTQVDNVMVGKQVFDYLFSK